ncbi:MAG TPA: ATP-binding cassette domain-containing protein [Tepidisphaeraceae bacterium]
MSKSFGGITVLRDVSVEIRAGEVHALMGENGAGKSTLLKIFGGVHRPDKGQVFVNGKSVAIRSPAAAQRLGISLIHQEPLSFPDLDVAENIFLAGPAKAAARWGIINRRKMYRQADEVLTKLGVSLRPTALMRGLSIADQQMVELAAALHQKSRILLMDEPTAALTPAEVEDLFRIVRQLRAQGIAIVFISHRLEEVLGISDRITVLRDGQWIATEPVAQMDSQKLISLMVGRPLGEVYEKEAATVGPALLEVQGLSSPERFENISLNVRQGEIVGIAGLVGAGRTELAETIFGLHPISDGSIKMDGKAFAPKTPREAIAHGIAYVPEDRQKHGVLPPFSIAANTTLASLKKISSLGWLRRRRERETAEEYRQMLRIRCRDTDQPVRQLSGGNQQKVVLSKWLLSNPRVLILDEPTRGIDIGAKAEVHHAVGELARDGKGILMISSDLPEVLAISDRILVMRQGRLTAEFSRADATQEKIMAAATGQGANEQATFFPSSCTQGEGRGGGSSEKPEASSQQPESSSAFSIQRSAFSPDPHPTPPPEYKGRENGKNSAFNFLRFREFGIALIVLVGFLVTRFLNPSFSWNDSFHDVLLYIPLILIVGMGQMMVIVSRNIDLSVGSILGFAAIVVGEVFVAHPAFPLWEAAILAAAVGALLGAANGILIALCSVPSIIATLGTLGFYRGLIFIYSGGNQVDPDKIPTALIRLSQVPATLPWIVIFAAALVLVTYLFLKFTRTGREIFAIGSNPNAAVLRGISVRRNLILIFAITGALSGLAGLAYASRFGYVNPVRTGDGFELIVISAVVIGGVSIFGGSGSVLGVVLGCVLLGLINVALPALGVSDFYQLAIYGLAILLAAGMDGFFQRLRGGEE